MSAQPSYISLSEHQRAEFERLSVTSGWRILSQSELPLVFNPFRERLDSAVLIACGTPSGNTYLVFNARRVDLKDRAVDQEPFAVAVTPSGASTGGLFLHHGDWEDRTTKPPAEFWDHVVGSGIGDYFLVNPPWGRTEGALQELPRGDQEAFKRILAELSHGVK